MLKNRGVDLKAKTFSEFALYFQKSHRRLLSKVETTLANVKASHV